MSNVFLYVVTVLVWGSTWIAIEFQLGTVRPEVSIFYRYLAAAAILFLWCAWRGMPLRYGLKEHARFAGLGLLLFCLNYILTYYAQEQITSALTAIVFSTMLWMNIFNTRVFFGVRSDRKVVAGAVTGIIGIVVLFYPEIESLDLGDATLKGAAFCVCGAFVASLGNMVSQGAQNRGLPIVQSNAYGMLYGSAFTGMIAYAADLEFNFDWSPSYVISLLYLVVFGSIIGFGAYLTLLGRIGAHRAGYAVVMFPVVALLISILFEGMTVGPETVVGIVLVVAGNLAILSRGGRAAQREVSTGSKVGGARLEASRSTVAG